MDEKQILAAAQVMFLQNKGRKEVIDFMLSNGITKDKSEQLATDAFLQIKDQRKEMMQQEVVKEKKSGMGNIAIGALMLIGGFIATMSTDRIWYGLMLVGIISIVSGLSKTFK